MHIFSRTVRIIGKIEEIREYKYYVECYKRHTYYSNSKRCGDDVYKTSNNIFFNNENYDAFYENYNTIISQENII